MYYRYRKETPASKSRKTIKVSLSMKAVTVKVGIQVFGRVSVTSRLSKAKIKAKLTKVATICK